MSTLSLTRREKILQDAWDLGFAHYSGHPYNPPCPYVDGNSTDAQVQAYARGWQKAEQDERDYWEGKW